MPNASVAPTGAEKTALKIIASKADASRTRPDDCRTNNDEDCLDVSISYSFWITVKTIIWCMPPGIARPYNEGAYLPPRQDPLAAAMPASSGLTSKGLLTKVYNIQHQLVNENCSIVFGLVSKAGEHAMLASERRRLILERVAEHQSIETQALAEELGVSEMTIRRDIKRLEQDGFLRQTYGGATVHVTKSVELGFNSRALQFSSQKRLIGADAARLIELGQTLFLGEGTTTAQFAQFLPPHPRLLVVTT